MSRVRAVTVPRPLAVAALAIICGIFSACGGPFGEALNALTSKHAVGGTVSGLAGMGLVIEDNGGDDLTIGANGPFTFVTSLGDGASFSVTVKTQPTSPAQTCTVTGGSGVVGLADVTTVTIVCVTNTYTVGGSVSGLRGSGLDLQDNGGDDLTVSADGSFTFATPLASGAAYAVTVKTQPSNPAQSCSVSNGSGIVAAANITNVTVQCVASQAATPLIVTPVLDTAHAATQVIPAASGGSVTAKGADGSIYTLTIPAKALLSDEPITLTPLTSVGNLPISGGLLAGVDLAPSGLELQQAATLTIQAATTIAVDQQVGFGYRNVSGEQEFHFQPLGLSSQITLSVTHFSGAGVGQGTPGNGGTPSTPLEQLQQQVYSLISQERQCQLLGGACDPNFSQELNSLFQQFYTQVVQPLVQQALTDDSVAEEALETLFGWERIVSLLGAATDEPFATEFQTLNGQINSILTNVYNKAYGRCVNDTSQAQRDGEGLKMIRAERALQLLGSGGSPNFAVELSACLTGPLALDIDSNATLTLVASSAAYLQENHASHVTAQNIQLSFDTTRLEYTGSGTLTYDSYTYSVVWPAHEQDCSSGSGQTGTISVQGEFDLNFAPWTTQDPPRIHITLTPNIGETDVDCFIDPSTGQQTKSPPVPDFAYTSALGYAHGSITPPGSSSAGSPYVLPINTTQTFDVSGSLNVGSGATVTGTEGTTLTLSQSN